VRRGERLHIDPHRPFADFVFDTSLVYEVSVLRVFAERYLLEVREDSPEHPGAQRLLRWMAPFVPIYPDRVPPTSILREFIGGSGFSY
jgi:uridine kinase